MKSIIHYNRPITSLVLWCTWFILQNPTDANGGQEIAITENTLPAPGMHPLRIIMPAIDVSTETFQSAIQTGTIENVRQLIQQGADTECRNTCDETPLHLAVHARRIEIIELLIESNANINARSSGGFTPLHTAVEDGNLNIVKILLDNGANINAVNGRYHTPLMLSLEKNGGHTSIAKCLVQRGADVTIPCQYRHTPLHRAIDFIDLDLIRVLISNGADKDAQNNSGDTPKTYAQKLLKNPAFTKEIHAHLENVIDCLNKETLWHKRKYALWLASDYVPLDTITIWYDLPPDVSRFAIGYL